MKYLVRGIVVILGIMLIFMLLTACSSGTGMKRDSILNNDRNTETEEFAYDDERDDYAVEQNNEHKKTYNKRENTNDRDVSGDEESDNSDRQDSFYQKGAASWYGREFQGRATASGDKFDMMKLTAAHKTLPFGTKLLVKNLENGKTVKVTVNDRGPYKDNRIIDLSYAAGKKLDMINKGETMVGIVVLDKGEDTAEEPSTYGKSKVAGVGYSKHDLSEEENNEEIEDTESENSLYLQAGAFYSRRNAAKLQQKLEELFNKPVIIINEDDMYKVRVKNINTRKEAERFKRKLEEDNISSFVVQDEN